MTPTTLTPGTRLGPYEVTAQIGVGGMGAVYRAHDAKLHRDVAIKVLLPAVANDPDRRARFSREAQVLASLNHPNIAAIYGLEESEGTLALVMELVEGPTLADKIAQAARLKPHASGLSLDEALPIAKQIAEALEAAHEQGIIHRDLKPANIKVRPDGVVKVLDFGLAKAMDPAGASSDHAMNSPTRSLHATQAGMILGTAAYMAPEQARGATVDKRADLWAFGVVVYEMLTGTRLFKGVTISDTLAHVLTREPDWTTLPPNTPAPIRRLLRRCLEKDRKRRLADAADARLDIQDALTAPAGDTAPAGAAPLAFRGTRLAWVVAAVAVLGAAALTVPAVRHLREAPPLVPAETRVDIVTPAGGDPLAFALSPDGRQLVFVAAGDGASRLWLRSLSTTTAQPLAGTEGAQYPFWAPDNRSVAFFADSQLKRLDLGGGAPRALAAAPLGRGGSWNADGVVLFAPNFGGPLFRVAAAGGDAAPVTTLDRQPSHQWPVFLPDGQHFLFYAQGGPDTGGIHLGALEGGAPTRLTAADTAATYLPAGAGRDGGPGGAEALRDGGWLLWTRAGTLVAQRLDLPRRALTGDPVPLADAVASDGNNFRSAVAVSATGLVAYRAGRASRRQLTWVDRTGRVLGTLGAPDEHSLISPRVAPDGRRVAVSRTVQGNTDLWLLDGARTSRLTFDAGSDQYPIWSPDGRQLVFDSDRTGVQDLYGKDVSGAGVEARLVASAQPKNATDWSADGRFLLYHIFDPQTGGGDLWAQEMDPSTGAARAGRAPGTVLRTPFTELGGRFSPDGRWVAYQSNASGQGEIYVRPWTPPAAAGAAAPAPSGQWQVSTAGGIHPSWRADGQALYYLGPDGALMAAPVTTRGTALEPGTPVALFPTRIVGGGGDNAQGPQYDVTRDGRFLINTVLDDAVATPITLIQNWRPGAGIAGR